MKNRDRAKIFLALCLLITSCGQATQVTPSAVAPTDIAAEIQAPFPTITPSPNATATIEPTPRPTYVRPTLIPTIDPVLLPELLNRTISIQTLESANGHKTQRITGWEYGFGTSVWYNYCPGYVWLDTNQLLLYPKAGQQEQIIQMEWRVVNVIPQPVVMNLETGSVWLPPVDISSGQACNNVFWSRDLGILINSGIYKETPAVFTHTFDGKNLAKYRGKLSEISPSKEKILIDNNILIDLRTNSRTILNWNLAENEELPFPEVFWTSDETRLYRCCYFYADLIKGISHRFSESDFFDKQGNRIKYEGLWLYRGRWVQNDSRFLTEWSWGEDGDIRYLLMFDPATGTIFDVRKLVGISNDWTCYQTIISPDGKYVWMVFGNGGYLIDLLTFDTRFYAGINYVNPKWSPDSQFVWIQDSDSAIFNLLSISDKALTPLPVSPAPETEHLWHPTDKLVVYPAKEKNALMFLDAPTMSYRELLFKDQNSLYKISNLAWSPNGDKLIFITDDHILWQVDYPSLENLKQIMASANAISGAQFSPDGNSIAFISGPDIYIVDTVK